MKRVHKEGFTLLEIMIAVFILTVVLSTVFVSYDGSFKVIDATESQTDIYDMARTALTRMQEDLESAYIYRDIKTSESEEDTVTATIFVGEDSEIEERDAVTLRFLSRAHIALDAEERDSGIAEISYYVKQNEEEEGLSLYRSETTALEEGPEAGTGGLVLCEDLFSVKFIYFDGDGKAYEEWDSTEGESKDKLPAIVSIMLEFVNTLDPDNPFRFVAGVTLPTAKGTYEKSS